MSLYIFTGWFNLKQCIILVLCAGTNTLLNKKKGFVLILFNLYKALCNNALKFILIIIYVARK